MVNDHLSEGQRRLLAKFEADAAQARQRNPQPVLGQRRPRRAPRMPRLPEPKPGSIAAVINDFEHCSSIYANERAVLWAQEFIPPNEVRAWQEVGLRTDDLGLIIDFRRAGVPPEAMTWKVGTETMLERIRLQRYSAYTIVQTLRKAGLLAKKSA